MPIRLFLIYKVRLTGLEPARRETLDPKSSASTNSATGAFRVQSYINFYQNPNYLKLFVDRGLGE